MRYLVWSSPEGSSLDEGERAKIERGPVSGGGFGEREEREK